MRTRFAKHRAAFTLVELLVVIGIIALLISLLLPALGKARDAANTIACLANLRSAGQAMQIYVAEYNGFLPGSANTSGRHFFAENNFNTVVVTSGNVPPGPIQYADYIAPLARMMRLQIVGDDNPNQGARYDFYRNMKQFLCPSFEGVLVPAFSGSPVDVGAGQGISYATAFTFLLTKESPSPGNTRVSRMSSGAGWWQMPQGYAVKLTKVGQPSTKVFMSDAAKFGTTSAPTYSLGLTPADGGVFSDFGPFGNEAEGLYRQRTGNFDPRILAFRHGAKKPHLPTGAYRINLLFFDGHAETVEEMEACNPALWVPKGTVFPDGAKVWPDVQAHYNMTFPFTVP
jgi:prepilin-type N-terminal cleavage/methylation domain-containing protein/prepilin-type processing-associated H-X9-DG protein